MLEELKQKVFEENLRLVKAGLVVLTWGNVSGYDEETKLVVIKPSGVSYDTMKASDMVVVDLDGNVVEGNLRPSSDTPTHLYLYKNFKGLKGIVHTHSTNAVAFAQAGRDVIAYGTTHADQFYGDIPCARELSNEEIENEYELNTGKVIVETFNNRNIEPLAMPAVLVKNHGPFTWGSSSAKAVEAAITLETVCEMALKTEVLNSNVSRVKQELLDKHYNRKHGKNAYYGQK